MGAGGATCAVDVQIRDGVRGDSVGEDDPRPEREEVL